MKKSLMMLVILLFNSLLPAQVPQKMSYQAVIRNADNQLICNQLIGMQISILQGSVTGNPVYVEIQSPTTNANGLVTLEIGGGTVVTGSMESIDWSGGIYFIKTETDPEGGNTYTITGTSQLLSVPYAMYAQRSSLDNLRSLTQAQIDTLSAVAGTMVMNISTGCINYFTGANWMAFCGFCVPQPSQAVAGPEQFVVGTSTTLQGNEPEAGTGLWEIVSGTGGIIADPALPGTMFSGLQGNNYELSWTISNPCGSSTDNVMIHFLTEPPPPSEGLVFTPYVDCLLWPNFDISNIAETGICFYTCAFIVDDQFQPGANPCWGGYPTLGTDYYQDKIAALRSQGGDIIMSFGGANGVELAYAATDEYELRDAYKTMIDAYDLTSIDFDIEGFLVAEPISRERRSKAIKLLQNEYPYLQVSLTLPVMPDGLTQDGINTVISAINKGVNLGCVNIMAMDYGPSGIDMGDAAISAGEALFSQLKTIYQNAGIPQPDSVIWSKVGICPMIGENDVPGEIFYLDDAVDLAAWASEKHIGRLSMWSANRDRQCVNPNDPLYSCSHIPQDLYEFSGIFGGVSSNNCPDNKYYLLNKK